MEPTRCYKDKVSILDLILTNQGSSFSDTTITPFTGSDHHMVSTRYYPRGIKVPTPHKYVDLRSYKRLSDPEIIRKCMNCLDIWDDVAQLSDIDAFVDCFAEIAQGLLNILCPVRKVRVRQSRLEWLDYDSVKHARKMKNEAHRKALMFQDDDSWRDYRRCRNFANN